MNRRHLLRTTANGFGLLALAGLLKGADSRDQPGRSATAPKKPHFEPKAKRVIFVFMHGGPSQVDTFDPKPLLTKFDGQDFPGTKPRT